MPPLYDCLCLGNIVADHVCAPVERLPASGELVMTRRLSLSIGGCASNVAVDLAKRSEVRVNAVMPGFFLGEQNRRLLTNEDDSLTDRGKTIIAHTPFARFGAAPDLHGTIHHLLADSSVFVTGTVSAVDGGFCAFSGV